MNGGVNGGGNGGVNGGAGSGMNAGAFPGGPAAEPHRHRAPNACPVCGHGLALTRLGCDACGTEIGGSFRTCEFCALDEAELVTLRVFLTSRGNLREVERHLGVSYPTARLRFNEILAKLGLGDEPAEHPAERPAAPDRDQILARVAAGTLSPEDARPLLISE